MLGAIIAGLCILSVMLFFWLAIDDNPLQTVIGFVGLFILVFLPMWFFQEYVYVRIAGLSEGTSEAIMGFLLLLLIYYFLWNFFIKKTKIGKRFNDR